MDNRTYTLPPEGCNSATKEAFDEMYLQMYLLREAIQRSEKLLRWNPEHPMMGILEKRNG